MDKITKLTGRNTYQVITTTSAKAKILVQRRYKDVVVLRVKRSWSAVDYQGKGKHMYYVDIKRKVR